MNKWQTTKTEEGDVEMICLECEQIYNLSNEWDRANLDWHEHN